MPELYPEWDYMDDLDDEADDWDDGDSYDDGVCTPMKCGDCWGGDGICMLEIEAQARQGDEYARLYVSESVPCPVCGALLNEYKIPVEKLWTWPGDFYNPIIPLGIFAVYDVPKGVVHDAGNVHHIFVGDGEYRSEKLITLLGDGNYIRGDESLLNDEIPF